MLSEIAGSSFDVPQSPVLGITEYCLYILPVNATLRHHKLHYHVYADDTHIYCQLDSK